jgi:hypothetical protein
MPPATNRCPAAPSWCPRTTGIQPPSGARCPPRGAGATRAPASGHRCTGRGLRPNIRAPAPARGPSPSGPQAAHGRDLRSLHASRALRIREAARRRECEEPSAPFLRWRDSGSLRLRAAIRFFPDKVTQEFRRRNDANTEAVDGNEVGQIVRDDGVGAASNSQFSDHVVVGPRSSGRERKEVSLASRRAVFQVLLNHNSQCGHRSRTFCCNR